MSAIGVMRVEGVRGLALELPSAPGGIGVWVVSALVVSQVAGEPWYLHRLALEASLPHAHRAELHLVTEGGESGTTGEISLWWRTSSWATRHKLDAYDLEQVTRACEALARDHWPHAMREAKIMAAPQPQGRLF